MFPRSSLLLRSKVLRAMMRAAAISPAHHTVRDGYARHERLPGGRRRDAGRLAKLLAERLTRVSCPSLRRASLTVERLARVSALERQPAATGRMDSVARTGWNWLQLAETRTRAARLERVSSGSSRRHRPSIAIRDRGRLPGRAQRPRAAPIRWHLRSCAALILAARSRWRQQHELPDTRRRAGTDCRPERIEVGCGNFGTAPPGGASRRRRKRG